MEWLLTHTSNDTLIWMLKNGSHNAELKINLSKSTFRLNHYEKRLFFIERGGLFRNRIHINTEYGILMGQLLHVTNRKSGSILVNGLKYYYLIDLHEIDILDRRKQLICKCAMQKETTLTELSAILFSTVLMIQAGAGASAMRKESKPLYSTQ